MINEEDYSRPIYPTHISLDIKFPSPLIDMVKDIIKLYTDIYESQETALKVLEVTIKDKKSWGLE